MHNEVSGGSSDCTCNRCLEDWLATSLGIQVKRDVHGQRLESLWETHPDVVAGTVRVSGILEVDRSSNQLRTSSSWGRGSGYPIHHRHYRCIILGTLFVF